jgi:hypothetical protein
VRVWAQALEGFHLREKILVIGVRYAGISRGGLGLKEVNIVD